jgi:hypothetical protein
MIKGGQGKIELKKVVGNCETHLASHCAILARHVFTSVPSLSSSLNQVKAGVKGVWLKETHHPGGSDGGALSGPASGVVGSAMSGGDE